MDRRLPRSFAAAATAVLVVALAVGWTVAHPPWRRIQRERVEEQLRAARDAVADERRRFADVERSLEYRNAVARRDRLAREMDGGLRERMDAVVAEGDRLQERLAALEERLSANPGDSGAELEEARRRYVRLTGTPGADPEELARLRELLEGDGSTADLRRRADELRAAIAADDREARELAAPLREAEAALEAFRAPLTRAEERLQRLEEWPIRVHENERPDGVVERCLTCHPGMDQLDATHPALGPDHPYDGWGCTVCHGGNGRSLRVAEAHRALTLRPWSVGPEYTLEPLIDDLESADRRQRAEAAAALRRITGRDRGFQYHAPPEERAAAVARWRDWWNASASFFRPPTPDGLDVWGRDASGRPVPYTGSGDCLRCHESRQRLHVRRWQSTKFTSFDRLEGVADPAPCLPCHTTGYDEHSGRYVQPGVTCEACHGPGAGYGAAMEAATRLEGAGRVDQAERLLDDVSRELRQRMERHNVCVDCHDPFGVKDLDYEHLQ